MTDLSVDDIAELRKQGDFRSYLRQMTGREVEDKPKPAPLAAVPEPAYRITHTGGWPLGAAASGSTPPAEVCTCAKCGGNPASRQLHREGEAA